MAYSDNARCAGVTVLLWLSGILAGATAESADLSWGYRVAASYNASNNDGLFYLEPVRIYNLDEVFLTYAHGGVYFHGTAFNEAVEGDSPHQQGVINELYIDRAIGDWEISAGKRRMEWGVGFGFRPLDVIKPQPRRPLILKSPEGLPLVAIERYSDESAITFLVGNDFRHNDEGYQSGGTEYALRYFSLVNGWDLQGVVHWRDDVDYEGGAGFAKTVNEKLAVHGSALFQRRYQKWINRLTEQSGVPLASTDPLEQRVFDSGLKGLVGLTYTWPSGHSLLFEYWYDDAGYSAEEWLRLRELTSMQKDLLVSGLATSSIVNANIAASSRVLTQPNPMQENLLLRWYFDKGEGSVPAVDVLYTPQDGGMVFTAAIAKEIGARYRLEYGLRRYGGENDSMSRALPFKYLVYGSLKATFTR